MILTNNKKIFKECRSLKKFGRIDQENIGRNRYYSDKYLKIMTRDMFQKSVTI